LHLTQQESWYLNESLKGETLMCQKLSAYMSETQDPELRGIIADLHRRCVRNVEMLIDYVSR
jgi:hypothetical protein